MPGVMIQQFPKVRDLPDVHLDEKRTSSGKKCSPGSHALRHQWISTWMTVRMIRFGGFHAVTAGESP
jgi:hypothetical protein